MEDSNADDFFVSRSLLDTDLYKLTMQQAVLKHFPETVASYEFTNRTKERMFSETCVQQIKESIMALSLLKLSQEERSWLKSTCTYFTDEYLDFLSNFQLNPAEQVKIDFKTVETDTSGEKWGELSIEIKGLWRDTILYEVPIIYIVSHHYYAIIDTKWDYVGQFELARTKGKKLFDGGVLLSEFGARRRRSFKCQEIVLKGLIEANKEGLSNRAPGKLVGTSNVHLARTLGLSPVGTIAHEWIMAVAALTGYKRANMRAMSLWEQTYSGNQLSIALTDTFTTKVFFDEFISDVQSVKNWRGLRHDSGDPFNFIPDVKKVYKAVEVDPGSKMLVFSDSLNTEKALALTRQGIEESMTTSMGIGTHLTNDFKVVDKPDRTCTDGSGKIRAQGENSLAMNIVVKIHEIEGKPCIKLSDDVTKVGRCNFLPNSVGFMLKRSYRQNSGTSDTRKKVINELDIEI